jgi:hypothetical protein
MAYRNAYIDRADQEIDFDIIFGKPQAEQRKKEKLINQKMRKSNWAKESINLAEN